MLITVAVSCNAVLLTAAETYSFFEVYIMAQSHGHRLLSAASLLLSLLCITAFADVPNGTDEITSLVTVRWSSGRNLATAQTQFDKLRLLNRSTLPIQGPIGLAVTVLSPTDVALANADGTTGNHLAYRELLAAGETLPPNTTTAFSSLVFENPKKQRIRFQTTPYGKLPAAPAAVARQINMTGKVKLLMPSPKFNRSSQEYLSKIKVTNLSQDTIYSPVSLAFPGIQPVTASLVNAAGQLEDGSDFVTIPLVNGRLEPKQTSPTLALSFDNPDRLPMQLTATVYGSPPYPTSSALFDADNVWNQRVDTAALHPSSTQMLAALNAAGGWGTGKMRIDFSINVLETATSTPFRTFIPNTNFYSPDCDQVSFPVPKGGAVEGETGYACSQDGDCHLLVVDQPAGKLYEMYSANITGKNFSGGCAVVWDLHTAYPADLRGEQCTSTDAAGLPITPLLFSPDEVAAGEINHAIRFILPNSRMRADVYVRPATHAGAPSGGPDMLPYGSRLRLRADFPLDSLPSDGARVIARAMQQYGMILADGGNIALTARNDQFTQHKWSEASIDSFSLQSLQVRDFEVIDTGPTIDLTYECVRNGQ
jgi:serine/threonine-protein kinase